MGPIGSAVWTFVGYKETNKTAKANLHQIAIIHTYSKQYKNSCRYFASNIITFMCIFSNKLYIILSFKQIKYTRVLGRIASIFYLNCEHFSLRVHFKLRKKISRILKISNFLQK